MEYLILIIIVGILTTYTISFIKNRNKLISELEAEREKNKELSDNITRLSAILSSKEYHIRINELRLKTLQEEFDSLNQLSKVWFKLWNESEQKLSKFSRARDSKGRWTSMKNKN